MQCKTTSSSNSNMCSAAYTVTHFDDKLCNACDWNKQSELWEKSTVLKKIFCDYTMLFDTSVLEYLCAQCAAFKSFVEIFFLFEISSSYNICLLIGSMESYVSINIFLIYVLSD